MKLILAQGNILNFKKIRTFSIYNNSYSLLTIFNNIMNNYPNYNSCLCKTKLYEEYYEGFQKKYKFLDNYNNNPELNNK